MRSVSLTIVPHVIASRRTPWYNNNKSEFVVGSLPPSSPSHTFHQRRRVINRTAIQAFAIVRTDRRRLLMLSVASDRGVEDRFMFT